MTTSKKTSRATQSAAEFAATVSDDDMGCCQIFKGGDTLTIPNISRADCAAKLAEQDGEGMNFTIGDCPGD